jgi:hypothetical protein
LRLLDAICTNAVLSLCSIDASLLALRNAVLRLDANGARLLTLSHSSRGSLRPLGPCLTLLGAHLDVLRALRSFGRRETLGALHARPGERLTLHLRTSSGSATAAAALGPLGVLASATASVVHQGRLARAAFIAVRVPACRGCDRQRCNARGEKHPGHDLVSFRTVKTARSSHRSNR